MRRLMIDTVDSVREVNRWEIGREELVPDFDELTRSARADRVRS